MARVGSDDQIRAVMSLAGVSRQSVKNFFSRPGVLATGTRRRIADAVAEVGYRPARSSAGSLEGVRVGYELPRAWGTASPIMTRQFECLVAAVQRASGTLIPFVVDVEVDGEFPFEFGGAELEKWRVRYASSRAPSVYQEMLRQHSLNAFVVNDIRLDDERMALKQTDGIDVVAMGLPVVDATTPEVSRTAIPFVETDNQSGISAMVRLLVASGCTRIGHVGFSDDGGPIAAQRRASVRDGCGPHASVVAEMQVPYRDSLDTDLMVRRLVEWLSRNPNIDAVVCDSDAIAFAVYHAAYRLDRNLDQTSIDSRARNRPLMLAGNDDSVVRSTVPVNHRWMTLRPNIRAVAEAVVEVLSLVRMSGTAEVSRFVEPCVVDPVGLERGSVVAVSELGAINTD